MTAEEQPASLPSFDDLKWHGFLSQGYVNTDKNNFLGSSTDGSLKFSEAGLNASWKPLTSLQVSGQVLYKQLGEYKPRGTRLDYAILDWRVLDTYEYGGGFRIGRLKNNIGFFNETRDVAATRPSILLPESIYVDYLRDIIHSSDSVGAYGHLEIDQGTLLFSANYGKSIFNEDTISAIVQSPTKGDLNNDRALSAKLSYEAGSGAWRTAVSYIEFGADFDAGSGESTRFLFDGEINVKQVVFSLALNWESWQFISEYQNRTYESLGVRGVDFKVDGVSYYQHLAYAFTPSLKGYFRHDTVYQDKNDKKGHSFALHSGQPAHNSFAKDVTLGFSYAPSFEWSFSLEVHHINGTHWLPLMENPTPSEQHQRWNMLLTQVAYRF